MNKTNQKFKSNKITERPLIGKLLVSLYLGFLNSFYPDRVTVYEKMFREYVSIINKLSTSRGKRGALSYNKLMRLAITRYLSGHPLPQETPGIKLNSDGLPSKIYFFHSNIKNGEKDDLKIIFTAMSITRGVILDPVNDFKTITDSGEGNLPNKWNTLKSAVRLSLGYRRKRYSFLGLHTSTKSGPNGQAMAFAFNDFLALSESQKILIKQIGGLKIENILSLITKTYSGIPTGKHWFDISEIDPTKCDLTRKISTFGDKEGKTRVIGILDYGSQTVLRPIHKDLEKILRKIPEDCTYDQSSGYSKLPQGCVYYSFDLTAATDRLPIIHQKTIISDIYGKRIAHAGESLLNQDLFFHKETGSLIKYQTGQPMGAYSSWPIMALQHHSLIHYAAILKGINPKGKYVVLGDDVVIADDQLAESYLSVMAELRVPISSSKTHKSKDICEFAKRGYYRGSEITAFPIHSLMQNMKRYYTLQNSIQDSRQKGYALCEKTEARSIIKLISLTGKKEQAPRIYKLYKLFDSIVGIKDPNNTVERIGNIRKVLLANGRIPKENLEMFETDESLLKQIEFVLEEFFLDLTSEGNNEMMSMMDRIKIGEKSLKKIDPDLSKDLSTCCPIISAFKTCGKDRSTIMDKYYKEFANDKDKLRASLVLLGNLPCVSERIVNTRNSHAILAAQSRLVKALLDYFMTVKIPDDEKSLEDWMSEITTIHSDPGQDEVK